MNVKPFRALEMWLFGFVSVVYAAAMIALFVRGIAR